MKLRLMMLGVLVCHPLLAGEANRYECKDEDEHIFITYTVAPDTTTMLTLFVADGFNVDKICFRKGPEIEVAKGRTGDVLTFYIETENSVHTIGSLRVPKVDLPAKQKRYYFETPFTMTKKAIRAEFVKQATVIKLKCDATRDPYPGQPE